MPPAPIRSPLVSTVALLLLASAAAGDTIVLTSGKTIDDVVVSKSDETEVVINRFRSRHPDMTWGIEPSDRIPRAKVKEVITAEPPLIAYRFRASRPDLSSTEHLELAKFCAEHKFKDERLRHLRLAVAADPENAEAMKLLGKSGWTSWSKGNPLADPELRRLEREFVQLEKPAEALAHWKQMKKLRTKRDLAYLERARRSFREPRGRHDEVPLTLRSTEAPGATFCLFVPSNYDPLTPTPLVIGLHGGGRGGADSTLVTGSGESAMNWYQREAEKLGWLVACPTALQAPWASNANEPLLDNLLEEMQMRFNVDKNRIYLAGHSMGGFGTWYWGPKRSEVWAACSPNAGGGSMSGVVGKELPFFIYHGSDDRIVGPGHDRNAAKSLVDEKDVDFVYTELDGVGHGWPDEVRAAMFEFFQGRWKGRGKKRATEPDSSFDAKVGKDEKSTFGDPSKIPEPGSADGGGDLKTLLEDLKQGGGKGQAAAEALSAHADAAAVKSVAKILRSSKSSRDVRELAATALGGMSIPDAVRPLARALDDEDYRVVEEATRSLGRIGLAEAGPPLIDASKKLAERFDASFLGGRRMTHTEYGVRLGSFGVLCDALAAVGPKADAAAAWKALESTVVKRVFLPDEPVDTGNDPRFVREPPAARATLAARLGAACTALGVAEAAPVLRKIAAEWSSEGRVAQPLQQAADGLASGE